MTRVRKFETSPRFEVDFHIFRETSRKEHPYTISVQFKRFSDFSLHIVFAVANYARTNIGNHGGHLHGIPSGSFPHNITIETVENNFVSQLHWLVQTHQTFSLFDCSSILWFASLFVILLPLFCQTFVFVSSISEVPYCVDVEGVFSHANNIWSLLNCFDMSSLVDPLRIGLYLCLDSFFKLLALVLPLGRNILSDLEIFSFFDGKSSSSPFPLQLSLASIFRLVE